MDLGPLLGLGLLWLVANALRKGGVKPPPRSGGPSSRPPVSRPTAHSTRPPDRPLPPLPSQPDPTQREGNALERLLQDLGRTLEEARASAEQGGRIETPAKARGRPGQAAARGEPRRAKAAGTPAATTSADREEGVVAPGDDRTVDLDDEAERVVQQRLQQVAARERPLDAVDHRRFDQRIRQEPADRTAVKPQGTSVDRLRQAIIWREILGPPVSLRDDADR